MEETGVVKIVTGPVATVTVAKKSMCENCTAGTCLLTNEGAELVALNKAGAKVGQTVRVALTPYTYLKGSLVVYGLPAAMLVIGAVVGKHFSPRVFESIDPELGSALFGFGFFAVSFLLIKLWSMGAEKKTEYRPVVVEIISENNNIQGEAIDG